MPIPDYESLMLPILKHASDGQVHRVSDLYDPLADHFRLTPEERRQPLPSNTDVMFRNRTRWALFISRRPRCLKA